ncbi:MAG TPA: transcription-repair coupling factor [Gammaproteobacteria bacterium]|nr:transcription-repair coupling factor [Gammaproteobacteria bacterium]
MNLTQPLTHPLPDKPGDRLILGQLQGASLSLAILSAAQAAKGLLIVITTEVSIANQLERELNFFKSDADLPVLVFPDWETLPYDHFSPHPDILSDRMVTLTQLPQLTKGILLVSVTTLMHRLPPRGYLEGNCLFLKQGQRLALQVFREQLDKAGYRHVSQVMQHAEYTVRGSLLDVFPMGSDVPYRIDLFDDEIDSLRTFDPESQRTLEVISEINLLPAHEFPLTADGIGHFRQAWREHFSGNPMQSPLYQSISQGESAAGIEYWLPLFFDRTDTLFDYLQSKSLIVGIDDVHPAAERFWREVTERYEQLGHDQTRPILPPNEVFIPVENVFGAIKTFPQLQLQAATVPEKSYSLNMATQAAPMVALDSQAAEPLHTLTAWLTAYGVIPETHKTAANSRVLFCAETAGRREVLESLLSNIPIHPQFFASWHEFLTSSASIGMVIAPLEQGMSLSDPQLTLITETQLFGQQVMQRRLRKRRAQEPDEIIRDLTELKIGSPVVHIDHGVGRYQGLQTLTTGEQVAEYLMLEYADNAKLYVPISSLNLISRYSGADIEHAPLHRLGSGQWEKIKRKATEKIRDVAAELLNIYAERAAKTGFAFAKPDQHYLAFAAAFPFEETPDQQQAISQVIADMTAPKCMDRLVCGDVGFGKTEVAMRAAFLAVQSHKQVVVLVPTTLLAEQHLHTFQDRFAKWPIRIEAISRFRSREEQKKILEDLSAGKIDIMIGTHKLLQPDIKIKDLGLLIVDEEHRFGVRQKDRIKALRAEVDLLTLTATPIPRTLNMALGNIRDLSIIATPPAKRLSVKTFVREYQNALIREAVLRETMRGGQAYFLHNEVQSIERLANELQNLLPEVRIAIAHGQMREQALERVMADFYHQRFNLLLCTTIIESGIDIPTANTMIINRADRFGLAQLHQLRGRVGRSHHQAYAYLLTPAEEVLTSDAKKRLTAIESLEDLGAGFMLATHDLEIRGAGELLGDEQSGHMQEIGFSLYMELLEETVKALKSGKEPLLDKPLAAATEINCKIPALIPENYLPDVHTRLMLYKRIANAKNKAALDDLQAEMIDRFGILPPATKNLFHITELKLQAEPLGVRKIDMGVETGTIEFSPNPAINMAALIQLVQKQPERYKVVGSEKLRFTMPEGNVDERIKAIESLLEKLSMP